MLSDVAAVETGAQLPAGVVPTGLDYLLIREITGKFVGPAALITVSTSKRRFISATSSQIPCATEQGINRVVAGNSIRSSRNPCA
jgi:hypothetical protein